jgi:hypothetical protein
MRVGVLVAMAVLLAQPAAGEERWAFILSGASGGPKYAEQMVEWRSGLQTALVDRYGFKAANVRVFVDETIKTGESGSAENVRKAFADVRKQVGRDDLLVLILLGHGTYDGDVAKFNLVGPDLTAADWATLLAGVPSRLVVVNTTEASFPFLERLSGANRVVITATDSAAQKYATVFPEYFVKAMREASSDLDKNGRTSIFEVFSAASAAVKQHYEQRGQLTTERAVFDDNGDGGPRSRGPRAGRRDGAAVVPRCRIAGRCQRSTAGSAPETAPRARSRGRGPEAQERLDGRADVGSRVRKAHARTGQGFARDSRPLLATLRHGRRHHTIGRFNPRHVRAPAAKPAPAGASALAPPATCRMKNNPMKNIAGTSCASSGTGVSSRIREFG